MRRTLLKAIPAAMYATVAGGSILGSASLLAQDGYPNRPVRLIVPFPPGGGADTAARILSGFIAERLGQPVVIENKPGGTGTVGIAYGLTAPADGYTLLWCTPAAQYLAPKSVRYDPVADFAPVSLTLTGAYILLVDPKLPIHSVAELIAAAKAKPGTFNYATAGTGGQGHLMGALFNQLAGTDMTMVPFSGEGPALVGIMGGQVQAGFISSTVALPQVKAGKLRALGATSANRLAGIPDDIPPIGASLPTYDVTAMNYIAMRAGTPRPIIDRLNKIINEALASPAIREKILAVGVVPSGSTPEELGRSVAAERVKWAVVMQKANIVLE